MTTPFEQERIEAIGDQLRAKIASKFTASTFLAGFALAVLTGQASAVWQGVPPRFGLFPPAVGMVFASLLLLIRAIVALDALTMPKRFWTSDPKAPPSSPAHYLTDRDLWSLQEQMVFIWTKLTVTASAITGGAVLAMLLPVPLVPSVVDPGWVAFGCAVVGAVIASAYGRWVVTKMVKEYGELVRGD